MACSQVSALTIDICYEEWKPYAYTDELGKKSGTVIDRLTALAGNYDIDFTFEQTSYSRCVEFVRRGVYDFALFTNEDDFLANLPTPITTWDLVLVVHKDNASENVMDGSRKRKLVISHEYQYPSKLMAKLESVPFMFKKSTYFASNQSEIRLLFKDVINKNADAILIDLNWANLMIKQMRLPLVTATKPLHSELQYIGYSNISPSKLKIMKQFMLEYAKP